MTGPVRSRPSLFGTCGWLLAGAEPRYRWEGGGAKLAGRGKTGAVWKLVGV